MASLLAITIPTSITREVAHVPAARNHFAGVCSLFSEGGTVYALNCAGQSLTEFSAATGKIDRILAGPRYDFSTDIGPMVSDGTDIWIASYANRITEIERGSGAVVRIISGRRYRFNNPAGLALAGGELWVANSNGADVTIVNASSGRLVRVLSGAQFHFAEPTSIAPVAGHVWVANGWENAVTELTPAGAVERVFSNSKDIRCPCYVAASSKVAWITSWYTDSVVEVSNASGRATHIIRGSTTGLDFPSYMALSRGLLWVVNATTVTEIDAANATVVRVLRGPLDYPSGICVDGVHVWVGNLASVAEFRASDGRLVRVVQ